MIDSTQIQNRGSVQDVADRGFTVRETADLAGVPATTVFRARERAGRRPSVASIHDVLSVAVAAELRKAGVPMTTASDLSSQVSRDAWVKVLIDGNRRAYYLLGTPDGAGVVNGEIIPSEALATYAGKASLLVNLTKIALEVMDRVAARPELAERRP